jgi:hypothetical protein
VHLQPLFVPRPVFQMIVLDDIDHARNKAGARPSKT